MRRRVDDRLHRVWRRSAPGAGSAGGLGRRCLGAGVAGSDRRDDGSRRSDGVRRRRGWWKTQRRARCRAANRPPSAPARASHQRQEVTATPAGLTTTTLETPFVDRRPHGASHLPATVARRGFRYPAATAAKHRRLGGRRETLGSRLGGALDAPKSAVADPASHGRSNLDRHVGTAGRRRCALRPGHRRERREHRVRRLARLLAALDAFVLPTSDTSPRRKS